MIKKRTPKSSSTEPSNAPSPSELASLPIVVRGAREHNLRDIDLELPRNQLICFTGVSGSGKSSLAFDTLFAEGQRRYLESLSNYARQFVGQMPKPDVDYLSGLAPAISISQKSTGFNPRSTVGTITELNDFLRVFFARCGTAFCPTCGIPISRQSPEQMVELIEALPAGTYLMLAPIIKGQKGAHKVLFTTLQRAGLNRARIDGVLQSFSEIPDLDGTVKHDIDAVVLQFNLPIDRSNPEHREGFNIGIEAALKIGQGMLVVTPQPSADTNGASQPSKSKAKGIRTTSRTRKSKATKSDAGASGGVDGNVSSAVDGAADLDASNLDAVRSKDLILSESYACPKCRQSFPPPSPQILSFNSQHGACQHCQGLGVASNFTEASIVLNPELSIQAGAIPAVSPWKSLPMWFKRALNDYAASIRHNLGLKKDPLKVTWDSLPSQAKQLFLNHCIDGYVAISTHYYHPQLNEYGTFPGIVGMLKRFCEMSTAQRERLEKYMERTTCPECLGKRLNPYARSIKVRTKAKQFTENAWSAISDCSFFSIDEAVAFFSDLDLTATQEMIAKEALKEIRNRLRFLQDVGLGYLSLGRAAPSLSGGESQRIRLATQIGAGLTGVLYVLDEPSIGLHPRDNDKLLKSLKHLRDLGNTLIVVEHDEDTMRAADILVDFGPGPGVKGGELIERGTLDELSSNTDSVTGGFLSRRRRVLTSEKRREGSGKHILVRGATHNNLKGIDVRFPLGKFIAVTGVSGSGKSSLVTDILSPALRNALNKAEDTPGAHKRIEGIDLLDKIIDIDQSPIGRTPRSNPATYTKAFDEIRDLFAELPESKRRGFEPGAFSFNTGAGRCSACEGHGANRLDMEFLPDLWVPCAMCEGKRYNRATLQVHFKGKSIADCLDLDVQQAIEHFGAIPKIVSKLHTLADVGLDYLKLGQPSPTLSGGEAQRIKLARELSKRSTGKTLYVLDEPTTGLHFHDIDLLLRVLQSLVDKGNTVIVVEHNLDLIQAADWIIDMGPEGGEAGGRVLCEGTPEEVAKVKHSYTGLALKRYFEEHGLNAEGVLEEDSSKTGKAGSKKSAKSTSKAATKPASKSTSKSKAKVVEDNDVAASTGSTSIAASTQSGNPEFQAIAMQDIHVVGASQHNLKSIDVKVPKNSMTVFCGHSGSGKTSLAMETIYAEGQRRFVESLSPYVRQFVGQMPKPSVERIDGLSPAIAIEQRAMSHTPRSTVGTVTEVQDYLRVLFARLGVMHCTQCDAPVESQTIDQIIDRWMQLKDQQLADANGAKRCLLLAPVAPPKNQTLDRFLNDLQLEGYTRVRINGRTMEIEPEIATGIKTVRELQVVVDRFAFDQIDRKRMTDSASIAMGLGNGVVQLALVNDKVPEKRWTTLTYSLQSACHACGLSFQPLTPHHFSFNTAVGWCPSCKGLGVEAGTDTKLFVNENLSLLEGGFLLWPNSAHPLSAGMLRALARNGNIPVDVPISRLTPQQRHVLFHGLPDVPISVYESDLLEALNQKSDSNAIPRDGNEDNGTDREVIRYYFRGLFPTMELEATRSTQIRYRLLEEWAEVTCKTCEGSRLHAEAAHVRLFGKTMSDLIHQPVGELVEWITGLTWDARDKKIGGELRREVEQRLKFLVDVGLDYLTIGRAANTLSGGESQRIRLASQLGTGLSGVLYVLDEPTIGLHPRDNGRLIQAMQRLRDLGNTVLVVEHDRDVIASSDAIRDFGPGAGPHGGTVVAEGTPAEIMLCETSVTGPYLTGAKSIDLPRGRKVVPYDADGNFELGSKPPRKWLQIRGANYNTLKLVDVDLPLGALTAITGPSGSGKSSLIQGVLYTELARLLSRGRGRPGSFKSMEGIRNISKVLQVDQSPLGSSPSSTPATYVQVFDHIRTFFSALPAAKYIYRDSFSFNSGQGRCATCEGLGKIKIEMHFLPDVWIECEACNGKRYRPEVLGVTYKGYSIHDVLEMSSAEALELFNDKPKIAKMLDVMCRVGLDYVKLGQSSATLSGGESQRVKLAAELCRPSSDGKTMFLLDEPTTGLHFDDIRKLMFVLDELVDRGNTVIIIEHNIEVIRSADWVIDMGPEAGVAGGEVVFAGTPEGLVSYAQTAIASGKKRSYTGESLAEWEKKRHQLTRGNLLRTN